MRAYAQAAREHPTWSVAYAQDVPKLLAELERLKAALDQVANDGGLEPIERRQIARHTLAGVVYAEPVPHDRLWHRLRFAEMVLDRLNAEIDGVPWREAARLSESLDGEPGTEPESHEAQRRAARAVLRSERERSKRLDAETQIETLKDTLVHIALERGVDGSGVEAEVLRGWALGTLQELWPDDFTPVASPADTGVQS